MILNDREIIAGIQKATTLIRVRELEEMLWIRYENQVHKHWHIFCKMLNHSAIAYYWKEEFESGVYEEAFRPAIKAIDLNKIVNDNWKFVSYFRFYLMNYRNETIKRALTQYKNETELDRPQNALCFSSQGGAPDGSFSNKLDEEGKVHRSAEEEALSNITRKTIEDGVKKLKVHFNKEECLVLDMMIEGINTHQISLFTTLPYSRVEKIQKHIRKKLETHLKFN